MLSFVEREGEIIGYDLIFLPFEVFCLDLKEFQKCLVNLISVAFCRWYAPLM